MTRAADTCFRLDAQTRTVSRIDPLPVYQPRSGYLAVRHSSLPPARPGALRQPVAARHHRAMAQQIFDSLGSFTVADAADSITPAPPASGVHDGLLSILSA